MFENYNFRIIKEDRKSLSAEVYPDFRIIIKAPVQAKDFEIDNFIKRKTLWIDKQLSYFKWRYTTSHIRIRISRRHNNS